MAWNDLTRSVDPPGLSGVAASSNISLALLVLIVYFVVFEREPVAALFFGVVFILFSRMRWDVTNREADSNVGF